MIMARADFFDVGLQEASQASRLQAFSLAFLHCIAAALLQELSGTKKL